MNRLLLIIPAFGLYCMGCSAGGDEDTDRDIHDLPFWNISLPLEERVDDLIGRLTPAQKVDQMDYDAPAIPSLGIPAYNWWNECLHGVARAGEATVFPQAIGLAATWNEELIHNVATAISDEARAKHHFFVRKGMRDIYYGLTFWTPNINIFRDPRWGRGQETYGEDPYLTGLLATGFIKGLQGDDQQYLKVVATSKHFAVHSGPEKSRHSDNYQTSNKDLFETYLPAFETTVKEGKVQSIMCAYNRFRDEACCGSNLLLDSILRTSWGFDGYVVSDCWAIQDIYQRGYHEIVETGDEAAALAVKMGTDINCGDTFDPYLDSALAVGLIDEATLDKSLKRLFTARFRLGMFDPEDMVPWSNIPYEVVASTAHADLALQAARESMVLLKNDNLLPLSGDVQSVAVIGPNAHYERTMIGNYHGTPGDVVTPYEGIRNKLPGARVTYAEGCALTENFPLYKTVPAECLPGGMTGAYYPNANWSGTPAFTRNDPVIDFSWAHETPVSKAKADTFSVVWSGTLKPLETGEYRLGFRAHTTCAMEVDGKEIISFDVRHEPGIRAVDMRLEKGRTYRLRIRYSNLQADPQAQLLWTRLDKDHLEEAVQTAVEADLVVLCLGLSPLLEGEEMPLIFEGFDKGDRTDIDLPDTQKKLLKKVRALNKPTVMVLMSGSAVAVNWSDQNIGAILQCWYPGQEGGKAIADILFGDYNPSGKLPVTFYKSVEDLPPFTDYAMQGRTYKYFKGDVLYPFGHGMSYTSFEYSNVELPERAAPGESLTISANVQNAGKYAGKEVVQLYVSHPDVPNSAIRSLIGVHKIELQPGESKKVQFTVTPQEYSYFNEDGFKTINSGKLIFSIGGKQPGFSGHADASTTEAVVKEILIR
jgi:beta-glucosidase